MPKYDQMHLPQAGTSPVTRVDLVQAPPDARLPSVGTSGAGTPTVDWGNQHSGIGNNATGQEVVTTMSDQGIRLGQPKIEPTQHRAMLKSMCAPDEKIMVKGDSQHFDQKRFCAALKNTPTP